MMMQATISTLELATALLLAGYVLMSLAALVSIWDPNAVRSRLAEGILLALSILAAGAVLKTIMLTLWEHMVWFVVVIAVRALLKHVFTIEAVRRSGTQFRPTSL